MAFTANFCKFSKRKNSTKLFTGSWTAISVELKDDCSVVEPILRLHNTANWNPSEYNYCNIGKFNRYYFVKDWVYTLGEWECYLECDVLSSFKNEIGNQSKYVLRSYSDHNSDIIDDFYPTLGSYTIVSADSHDFNFARQYTGGSYVLGLVGRGAGAGAVKYYVMSDSDIRDLITYMFPSTAEHWTDSFSGMVDSLYRSVYDPFQYIKSCKWFPFDLTSSAGTRSALVFGNYEAVELTAGGWEAYAEGAPLYSSCENWISFNAYLDILTNWQYWDAKYKCNPYCHAYITLNPFGIIEINPMDINDSPNVQIEVALYPDLISGECLLKIYKTYSGSSRVLLTEKVANIGVDINLSSTSTDFGGVLRSIGSVGAGLATMSPSTLLPSSLAAAGGVLGGMVSSVPTMSSSLNVNTGGMRALEGIVTLYITTPDFADEDPAEFGYATYKTKTISTLSGYVKCRDGEHDVPGYSEEKDKISTYLQEGFFYE